MTSNSRLFLLALTLLSVSFFTACGSRSNSEDAESSIDTSSDSVMFSGKNTSPKKRKAGERAVITVDGVQIAFRWCPAGEFMMGSPESEEGRNESNYLPYDIEKQHKVTLTKGFWMMETEVTIGMFKAFVNDTGYECSHYAGYYHYGWTGTTWQEDSKKYSWLNPGFDQDDNHPVTGIFWGDAVAFGNWLSQKTGQRIQLPTEAQWEYACRAGCKGAYSGKLNEMAWFHSNSEGKTHPVGIKKPNSWGLYDMHGNVSEWTAVARHQYPSESVINPKGGDSDLNVVGLRTSNMMVRGGSWLSYERDCRSAFREDFCRERSYSNLGFRLMMVQ